MRLRLVLTCCLLLTPASRADLILAELPPGATQIALRDDQTTSERPAFGVEDPVAGLLVFTGDTPIRSDAQFGRVYSDTPLNWSEFLLTSDVGVTGISFDASALRMMVDVNDATLLINDQFDDITDEHVSVLATAGDRIHSIRLMAAFISNLSDFRVYAAPDTRSTPEPATLVPAGLGVLALIGWGWRRRRQPPISS
jgi:hypothetical protein